MTWFRLTGDERIKDRCASEGCAGQPTWRLEAGGIGSNYCPGCKAKIDRVTCSHEWRTDGHGNEFCLNCFVSKPDQSP